MEKQSKHDAAREALAHVRTALQVVKTFRENNRNIGDYRIEQSHSDLCSAQDHLNRIVTGHDPEHRAALKKFRKDYLNEPSRAYFICEQERTPDGGYIACLAEEDKPGYAPLRGNGEAARPWSWGTTKEEAQRVCDEQNLNDFGITPDEARQIVLTSMAASRTTESEKTL